MPWRDLEMEMRSRLRGRRLVVEIGLTAQLQKDVEAALDRLIRVDTTPAEVASKAPALLAVGLVAHGVYRYEQGNYWDGFPLRSVGVNYGPAFERAITMLKLESFNEMVEQENAARYVARILAHGGIPKYCLGDFFGLLQHGLANGAEDASDLLTIWRARRAAFVGVDKPISRFLMFGGAISRDYLDRSIDLYREWASSGQYPSPDAAGLPVAVITELRRLAEQGAVTKPVRGTRRPTGARPSLTCDPWDALGPTVILPALGAYGAARVWTVSTDSGLRREPASASAAKAVPVGPSREWEVALSDGDGTSSTTLFEGLDNVPVLFFSPRTGALVSPGLGLTAEDFWVLRPADKEVLARSADGTAAAPPVIEVLPEPTGDWSGYVFEHLDFSGATELAIGSTGEHRSVSLRTADRPVLDGSFLSSTVSGDGQRVCAGGARLTVPAGDVDWTVRVGVDGDLHSVDVPAGGEVDLVPLLPADRAALVTVAARGVLGSDLRDSFCWVPGLMVEAPERLTLPTDPLPSVAVTASLVPLVGHEGSAVTLRPEPGRDRVEVLLSGASDPVLLAVQLPVLRWGPVVSGHMDLGTRAVPLTTLDFADGAAPALAVSTGRPGTRLVLALEVAGTQRQSWEAVTASGARGQYRYDLLRLSDTVGVLEERADLLLHVGEAGVPVRVATIAPQFEFTDLSASALHDGDTALIVVTFTEHRHANGRVLRLWPRHRPWDPPISASLPDEATREAELSVSPPPPLGEYLAELTIDDGFSFPVRPGEKDPTVVAFRLGGEAEYLQDLRSRADADPAAVVESILATGRPSRDLEAHELADAAVPALTAWSVLHGLSSPNWMEQRSVELLQRLLATAAPALGAAVDDLADDEVLDHDDLLCLAVELAPLLARSGGSAQRSTWRWEPALACLLELGSGEASAEDATAEFLGWSPADGLDAIDEADDSGRVGQQWLGMDHETLELIRTMLQFEVRPRPLSQDGRIAATFEWLKANAGERARRVEQWRASHHRLATRPVPVSEAILRHLDARRPAQGAASWGDFARLTLVAALHVCGRTREEPAGRNALLEAADFAPQQVRRDLVLGWILVNDLLRDSVLDDLPTEIVR